MDCSRCAQFDQLRELSAQVVIQYEELYNKYTENINQYEKLRARLQEREKDIQKMNKLIEPAIQEYEKMKTKYEIELMCRQGAENFAVQCNQQNKKLKRQSNMLLSRMTELKPFNIHEIKLDDDDDEPEKDNYKEYTGSLNKTINDLKNEVASLRTQLSQKSEENAHLKEKNEKTNFRLTETVKGLNKAHETLTLYKESMGDLAKVSEVAYREYEELKEKYEQEHQFVNEIYKENAAMKKQSQLVLAEMPYDKKYMEALLAVEDLTKAKKEHEREIESLRADLELAKQGETTKEEGERVKDLTEENNKLMTNLEDYEKRYADLESQYKALQKKLDEALHPPAPPPPPPPPLPALVKSKGFLTKIKGKKTESKKKAILESAGSNVEYSKALDEMMKRINSGKALNKVLKPTGRRLYHKNDAIIEVDENDPEATEEKLLSEGSEDKDEVDGNKEAMGELNSILSRFKRAQSENDLSSIGTSCKPDDNSELAQAFNKVKGLKTLKEKQKDHSPDSKQEEAVTRRGNAMGRRQLSGVKEESSAAAADEVF